MRQKWKLDWMWNWRIESLSGERNGEGKEKGGEGQRQGLEQRRPRMGIAWGNEQKGTGVTKGKAKGKIRRAKASLSWMCRCLELVEL